MTEIRNSVIPVTVTLDDESKELIRQLVKAVDRIADAQAPKLDTSFGDGPRRLVEPNLDTLARGWREVFHGEGDWVLHDDEKEGDDIE